MLFVFDAIKLPKVRDERFAKGSIRSTGVNKDCFDDFELKLRTPSQTTDWYFGSLIKVKQNSIGESTFIGTTLSKTIKVNQTEG